jgi:hypothetical protein
VQTGETEKPTKETDPFVGEKAELFRFSRSAKGPRQNAAKYVQQQQQEQVENDQVNRQQQVVEQTGGNQNEQQQQQVVANQLPAFGSGAEKTGDLATTSQLAEVDVGGQQQKSSSTTSSTKNSGSKSKTITTTTTTTTTTTQNNQDQPQVAQIKEIRVHTVPLSEAVHYANYMVVPTSSGGSSSAHLEESSSSSSSSHRASSSSTTSETEQVAVAPAPTVVVNPPPAAVAPDCVFHRLIVERPVSSQLVVNVPPEVHVSHSSSSSSSSSRSSKMVQSSAPETTVYSVTRRVFVPPPVYSAKVVQVAAPVPASKEEHFRSESHSSRQESHGLGHSMSSSSSSSSSRTSKSSSTTTTSQTAALVAPPPPPPPVQTVTVVRQAAPVVAVKTAPLVHYSTGQNTNDVSVSHQQSGPNYNYGYSIKQHSSEPSTKGVVVGDRVVYLK